MPAQSPWGYPGGQPPFQGPPYGSGSPFIAAPVDSRAVASIFIGKVYRWMAVGLGLTGLTAFVVAGQPSLVRAIFGTPLLWGLLIAELVMVIAFGRVATKASFGAAAAMFVAYSVLSGVTFSVFFLAYTQGSIAGTFFVTGGAFAAVSVYAATTRRDLAGWGQFLFMGLVGIVLASVVNLFVRSDMLDFVVSCAGVVVFGGLAAYHTQRLRAMARLGDDRLALRAALALYLDFINLFLSLLRFFARER